MVGKWLELLKEIAPRVTRVALLFNPTTAPYAQDYLSTFKAVAASFAWKRLQLLFATPLRSNLRLPRRGASRMVVWSR
jgi:putative ABC transport system substrate-binding protein